MTIEIIYDHTRVRSTEYTYTIVMDGDVVGCASTFHAAELVAQEVERREDIARLNGAINALETVDQAITAEIERLSVEQPLLAQCAHAIRAGVGNVPAGGGIIDELRRCDQALRREGW